MEERMPSKDLYDEIAQLQIKKQDLKHRIQQCYRMLNQQDNVGLLNESNRSNSSFDQDIDDTPILKKRKYIMKLELEHEHISNLIEKLKDELVANGFKDKNLHRCSSGHSPSCHNNYDRDRNCNYNNNYNYNSKKCNNNNQRVDFTNKSDCNCCCNCRSDVSNCSNRSRTSNCSRRSIRSDRSDCSKNSACARRCRPENQSKCPKRTQDCPKLKPDCSTWEMQHPPRRVEIIGVIVRVFPQSPGRKAGLRPGDFIVEFGDINPQNYNGNPASLVEYAESCENQRITIKIFRGGKISCKKLVPKSWDGCGLLGFRFGNV